MDLPARVSNLSRDPTLDRLAGWLRERKIVEKGTLVVLAAAALHAAAARKFRRIDHWEVSPGGWLPLPGSGVASHEDQPVGSLLDALERGAWESVGTARRFSARLSDSSGHRMDLVIRRIHRERRHSLSLDLWGDVTPEGAKGTEDAFKSRLPIVRSTMTHVQYG